MPGTCRRPALDTGGTSRGPLQIPGAMAGQETRGGQLFGDLGQLNRTQGACGQMTNLLLFIIIIVTSAYLLLLWCIPHLLQLLLRPRF